MCVEFRCFSNTAKFFTDGNDYAFTFDNDKKPEGLAEVKDGDKVTVTYTGTVSAVDAFSGTVVSVKAAK